MLEAPVKLIPVQRNCFPHIQPQPAGRPGQAFRVVLGKVRETDFHPGVIQPDGLAIGSDDAAAREQPAGVEGPDGTGLPRLVVGGDVQKGFQAGLDAGVGGMGVNLKDQVGLCAHH